MSEPPARWGGYESSNDRWPLAWMGDEGLEEVRFVDYPLLQASTFHLLAGPLGVGKGALCARWVARCTNGEMFGEPRPAIWIANEETARKDLNPRIKVAGGDMMKVATVPKSFRLPRDVDALGDYATSVIGEVGLIVIDPIASHTGGANTNAEEEVRLALEPLAALAETIGIMTIGVRHLSSKESRTGVLARILGSTAWVAVPRAILAAVKDAEGYVHVRAVKGSRVPDAEAGRKFHLEGLPIEGFERTVVAAIEAGESDADLDQLLEVRHDSRSEKARRAIVRLIREAGGRIESDVLDGRVAAEADVTARTVQKLRMELRDRGWLRHVPVNNEDGTRHHWDVTLTNFAPYDRELATDQPEPGTPRARVHNSGVSGGYLEETSPNLFEPDTPLTPYTTPQKEGDLDSTSPTYPDSTVGTTCPTCGSTNVGFISGRCHACGEKVHDLDLGDEAPF
jgi:hypothetical protein